MGKSWKNYRTGTTEIAECCFWWLLLCNPGFLESGYSSVTQRKQNLFFLKPERHRLPPMSTLHWFDFECDKDKTLRTLDFIPKCQLWWCRIVDGGDTTGAVHLFQTMERIQQMDGRNRNIKWKYVSAHKAIICQSKTNKIAIIMESKENISTLMWEWELLPLPLSHPGRLTHTTLMQRKV